MVVLVEAAAVSATLVSLDSLLAVIDKFGISRKVENETKVIKKWLVWAKAYVDKKESHDAGDPTREMILKEVRDMGSEIETVLELYATHSLSYTYHEHRVTKKVHKSFHHLTHWFQLHGLHDQLTTINSTIKEFLLRVTSLTGSSSNRGEPTPTSDIWQLVQVSPLFPDKDMVGYENQKRDVMHCLLEDEDKKLVRLAVEGPSGSGKTTFVKNVYREIKARFQTQALVHIGRCPQVGNVFRNLLEQFNLKLCEYLNGKRYLLVLDDVWRDRDWDDKIMNKFLDDASKGSRVIVTTRSTTVAHDFASSGESVFRLDGLEWPKGWELFCRKAFPNQNGECPPQLKEWSARIVKRCEGLPLSIGGFGGELSGKPALPNEWERFYRNLGCETWKDSSNLKDILIAMLTGYMDLSSNLKSCFLYFSIFPENCSVQRGRLMRLWLAEGFATRSGTITAEEVANDYLNELIDRNLIHVTDWDFVDGLPRSVRVHSLVLKFIIKKSEDENFTSIFNKEHASQSKRIRRLSVEQDQLPDLPPNTFSYVGSVFLREQTSNFDNHLGRLKLLRVLDFEAAPLTDFPKGLRGLTLIKYLSFKESNIKRIPSSIKKLYCLEKLDLEQTEVTELPKEISHLGNLCHLLAYDKCRDDLVQGVKTYDGIRKLKNLQDLSLVKVEETGKTLEELKFLTQLRKLGLTGLSQDHGKDLCAAVDKMENLRTLDVCTINEKEYHELGEVTSRPKTLECLYLKGLLRELPPWISSLDNLLRIVLKWSKLEDSPLAALGCLPNLLELQLVNCYLGEELTFKTSCFRKLKILVIEELVQLHSIEMEDKAMPDLVKLSLLKCPRLHKFPLGIGKINDLSFHNLPDEAMATLRNISEGNVVGHAYSAFDPSFPRSHALTRHKNTYRLKQFHSVSVLRISN